MFEAVIFDFDGVILDSEPLHYEACCIVLNPLGVTISYDEYAKKYLGLSDKEMFPKLLTSTGHHLSPSKIDTMIKDKIENYIRIIETRDDLPITPGVEEYIYNTIQNTQKIAICSASIKKEVFPALKKLDHGNLEQYFDVVVTAEDVHQAKPSPEGYLLTAQRLNITPNQCLVIEDSPHGVKAAKNAGMYVIALSTTFDKHQLRQADKIINSFTELS